MLLCDRTGACRTQHFRSGVCSTGTACSGERTRGHAGASPVRMGPPLRCLEAAAHWLAAAHPATWCCYHEQRNACSEADVAAVMWHLIAGGIIAPSKGCLCGLWLTGPELLPNTAHWHVAHRGGWWPLGAVVAGHGCCSMQGTAAAIYSSVVLGTCPAAASNHGRAHADCQCNKVPRMQQGASTRCLECKEQRSGTVRGLLAGVRTLTTTWRFLLGMQQLPCTSCTMVTVITSPPALLAKWHCCDSSSQAAKAVSPVLRGSSAWGRAGAASRRPWCPAARLSCCPVYPVLLSW
jgi:hypothetical protein